MRIDLPGSTVATRSDGLCAELYPSGDLRHLGYYRDGKPQGWVLDLEQDAPLGALTRTQPYEPEPGEENSSEPFREWVENWVGVIFEEAEHRLRCAFCGKKQNEVLKLIAGPTCYICNECVQLCQEILATEVV